MLFPLYFLRAGYFASGVNDGWGKGPSTLKIRASKTLEVQVRCLTAHVACVHTAVRLPPTAGGVLGLMCAGAGLAVLARHRRLL